MPALQALPWDIPQPEALPDAPAEPEALLAPDDKPPPEIYGPITSKYLRKFATDDVDKKYGLKGNEKGQLYLGKYKVDIGGDNIKIGDTEYQGTEGFWNLLMMKKPDKKLYRGQRFKKPLKNVDKNKCN